MPTTPHSWVECPTDGCAECMGEPVDACGHRELIARIREMAHRAGYDMDLSPRPLARDIVEQIDREMGQ